MQLFSKKIILNILIGMASKPSLRCYNKQTCFYMSGFQKDIFCYWVKVSFFNRAKKKAYVSDPQEWESAIKSFLSFLCSLYSVTCCLSALKGLDIPKLPTGLYRTFHTGLLGLQGVHAVIVYFFILFLTLKKYHL